MYAPAIGFFAKAEKSSVSKLFSRLHHYGDQTPRVTDILIQGLHRAESI